jgi:molybdopterin-containing oxidoreductase family iron-sulfur binding subunit
MEKKQKQKYGMVIDLDRCTGCGACMIACAVENNVAPGPAAANERTGITWMRVYRISNGANAADQHSAYIPVSCQQCEKNTPCVSVCPQKAVEVDPATGIVNQMPQRCLGCRYCMTACPYHARYFNWWDPEWPEGMSQTLNPDVSPRMRGVVEKCNLCHGRLHAARAKAAASGRTSILPEDYQPACAEACPSNAIHFGDLSDEGSEVARLARNGNAFRLLERLGTGPKIYYFTGRAWIREAVERHVEKAGMEAKHG